MQSTDDLANELNAYGDLLFDLDNTLFSTEDYDRGAFADIANIYPNISDLASYLLKTKKETAKLTFQQTLCLSPIKQGKTKRKK